MHKLGLVLALVPLACSSSSKNDSALTLDDASVDAGSDAVGDAAQTCNVQQTDGDCQRRECDGSVPDPSDVHVDGKECTKDLCDGTTPKNELKPPGAACGLNDALTCNAEGACTGCIANAECGQPTCSEGELTLPICSGGACLIETERCGDYACKGTNACHTSCTLQSDCAPSLGCTDGTCVECVTCSEWFEGGGPGAFCEDSGNVTALFEGCGCSATECAAECAASICSTLSPPPDATCRACLEVVCPTAVATCKADVLAGAGN
jgi:hypothetical protein